MIKIILKQVYLLNWYGFGGKTIPVGKGLSLIRGENECGRSTAVESIRYASTGDTEFNKATSATKVGIGRRTLPTYTRCLIDPDTGKCARPANQYPIVYTHIALEYFNELYNTAFVLGVILKTDSSDDVESNWYSLEGKTLKEVSFFSETDGKKHVLSAKQFREINKVELMQKEAGIVKFMTMTGLKLQKDGITKYQRKLRSIMTYNPDAKIRQFIKESVLEEKIINLNKLKEAKENIDDIMKTFKVLENEINALDDVLRACSDYSRVCSRLTKDDAKIVYKNLLNVNKKIEANRIQIKNNSFEIERLTEILKQEKSEKEQKDNELRNAYYQLDRVDGTKIIQEEKDRLKNLENKSEELREKINALDSLSAKVKEYAQKISMNPEITDLSDPNIPAIEKNNGLEILKEKIGKILKENNIQDYRLQKSLEEIQEETRNIKEIIDACDHNLPDYSRVSNQQRLIKEINNRFKELNINSEARFSGSFVVEIKDEEWRNSIETFLGVHRYSILVEPMYFDIANEVLNRSQYRYVELVNTKLLNQKEFETVEDSLINQLDIKNKMAKKYFTYWLGRIHAAELNEVAKYENALSKEGKISRNMAVSFLDFRKLDTYCLGEESVKLNREKAVKSLQNLQKQQQQILEKRQTVTDRINLTKYVQELLYKEYDLDAPANNRDNKVEIVECEAKIRKFEDALKHNNEYLTLVERVTEIERTIKSLNGSIDSNTELKAKLETENNSLFSILSNQEKEIAELEIKMKDFLDNYSVETKEAKEEYDLFVEGKRNYGDVMIPQTRNRTETEKGTCERAVITCQNAYNVGKRLDDILPAGPENEAVYRKKKNKLQIDNLEEIKEKLSAQTRKYESIFKNEFVLKVKTNIEKAQEEIRDINKQLRKLKFSTTYQFDVKGLSDSSHYAKILDYADYLKRTNRIDDGQMTLNSVVGYDDKEAEKREEEIKEIVNKVISKNDDNLLNDFADYRNYMEYEVVVNNDEITNGRLSKLAGYNSGAGTQIPYTIILSAALAIIYNARQNSTRLVFIDEPFEKMSDSNIKIMLEFFKTQDFQVIFCAPPNKLNSIGKECDTIIPIQKISKSNMTFGAIKFNEKV